MTAVLESYLTEATYNFVPGTFTEPLSEAFISDGPKLRKFCELFWKTQDGRPFKLDAWQAWLIDAVLERYPDNHPDPEKAGRLRYREVVISVARQNGKSVFAAIFGLYGLMMHEKGPTVIGLASSADQANIIYKRVKYVIDNHPALKRRFRTTGTRGISRLDEPGMYQVKPAKADALQGIDTTLCLFDEVHLCDEEMWSAMVLGTSMMDDGLVLGITTAGDADSALLERLYKLGREAAAGDPDLERFGFFCWEAADGSAVDDPVALMAANPVISAGRRTVEFFQQQVRTMPPSLAKQFRLNLFGAGASAWLDVSTWASLASGGIPDGVRPVVTIDRTPGQSSASISLTAKVDGKFYYELYADLSGIDGKDPTDERLLEECLKLNRLNPLTFVVDGLRLKELAKQMERYGLPVRVISFSEVFNACAFSYRQIATGNVSHDGNPRVGKQIPNAAVKSVKDSDRWRLVKKQGAGDIDMLNGLMYGLFVAETYVDLGLQLF
jgi:phage terminase large subunit-like protein